MGDSQRPALTWHLISCSRRLTLNWGTWFRSGSIGKSSIFIVGRIMAASQKKKTRDDLLISLALTPWTTCLATYTLGDPILKHNSYHRAHEPAVLKSFSWFATTAARELVSDERIIHPSSALLFLRQCLWRRVMPQKSLTRSGKPCWELPL